MVVSTEIYCRFTTNRFGFDACTIEDNGTRIRDVSHFVMPILSRL